MPLEVSSNAETFPQHPMSPPIPQSHSFPEGRPHDEPRHPMRIVCRRTGLKPDLIRAWERRHSAIEPSRSATRRRLYSDADIERLRLLKRAVDGGRGIRLVAHLTDDELAALIREDEAVLPGPRPTPPSTPDRWADRAMAAVLALDDAELERILDEAAVQLGRIDLIETLIVPFMERVGDAWRRGELRPVHEHLATARLRSFVGGLRNRRTGQGAPILLVTTPAGQRHELGALAAAVCAASEGWDALYLGTDLPSEEIAAGAVQVGARAVALSLTYPPDDAALAPAIVTLRRLLDDAIPILVGGRVVEAYAPQLPRRGVLVLPGLPAFRQELVRLRNPAQDSA